MGFFSFLFGRGEYARKKLSNTMFVLTKDDIEHSILWSKMKTITAQEKDSIVAHLTTRRLPGNKMSLRRIDMVLMSQVWVG